MGFRVRNFSFPPVTTLGEAVGACTDVELGLDPGTGANSRGKKKWQKGWRVLSSEAVTRCFVTKPSGLIITRVTLTWKGMLNDLEPPRFKSRETSRQCSSQISLLLPFILPEVGF